MKWGARSLWGGLLLGVSASACAQQDPAGPQQPPAYTAPALSAPDARQSAGQQAVPGSQTPELSPAAPLPDPASSTIPLRALQPLTPQVPAPRKAQAQAAGNAAALPKAEAPSSIAPSIFHPLAAYRTPRLREVPAGDPVRLSTLVRDGKLYLSLRDAVTLAIENNLDVEISRYDLLLAETDLLRAQGGGTLRGIDYTVLETAPGVGSVTNPLLNTPTTSASSPTNVNVTDLSQITQSGNTTAENLSQNLTNQFATGPAIPLLDPVITAQGGYLRRSNQVSLVNTGTGTGTGGTGTGGTGTGSTGGTDAAAPLEYLSAGLDFQQGFTFGGQLEAFVSNAPQVLYAANSQFDPLHAPSTSITFTQPLLRGRGRDLNLRFVRIAQLDRQVSRFLFEQQVLETIYGISRLYYDLVSLGENIGVKEEAVAAAERLAQDDQSQVEEGTLAPVELTRAKALVASSRLDLIQARSEYRQQEVILREQVLRNLSDPASQFAGIVPTDRIDVPAEPPALDVAALTADALENRPDLAQAALQIQANTVSARGTLNSIKPLVNVYANVQTRGSSLVPYQTLGSTGNGQVQVPAALTQGGLRLSTIYQGGIQVNLPLRNRIAQADAARDLIQLRQAEGRTAKLEDDIRQQVENASIAIESAHQAYAAAVESRNYQQQLLQAEIDKFTVGASTNFLIVQDQAYLAQARSTEVAARSDYMKAQISLDRALGNLLAKNGIVLDEAIQGHLNVPSQLPAASSPK